MTTCASAWRAATAVLMTGAMLGGTPALAAGPSSGSTSWNADTNSSMKLDLPAGPMMEPTSPSMSPAIAPPLSQPSPEPGLEQSTEPMLQPMLQQSPQQIPPPLPSTTDAAPTPDRKTEAARGNPLWAVPLSLLHNTRDRPLFSSSRRPPPPADIAPPRVVAAAPPAPPPPKPAKPELSLIGTIVGDGDSIGVFLEAGTDKVLRLHTGEGHEGWILREVDGRKATLDNDTTSAVLVLPAAGSDPQDAVPSPYARGTRRVHH